MEQGSLLTSLLLNIETARKSFQDDYTIDICLLKFASYEILESDNNLYYAFGAGFSKEP